MFPEKINFLEKILGRCKYSHNTKEAEFYCCFCFHHKKKLSINIETDNFKCWICGKAGKSLLYVLKKTGTSYDIENYIKNFRAKNVNVNLENNDTFSMVLPKEFIPVTECKNSVLGKRAFKYLIGRGLTGEDILKNKIGVAFEGLYRDRLILPSFDKNGNLNYFVARTLSDSTPKYLGPSIPKGYKTQIVFNELNIDWNRPVTVVEGFFDALKAENAIPLFGSLLQPNHATFQAIVKNDHPVYLAGDSDAIGKFQQIGKMFMDYGIDAYFIDVRPFKDVGELTKEQFFKKYQAAMLLTRDSIFRQKLEEYVCK